VATAVATEIVTAWQRQAGDDFAAHFRDAWTYFSQTVDELASEQASWTISDHEGHAVLLLASDTAFALIAFSGPPDAVTIKGALHPLDEGVIRVSFSDELAAEPVEVRGMEAGRPMVRRWSFDWHGRLQLPIEYWVWPAWPADPTLEATQNHHTRQRAMAHKLAAAAGWPMPSDS
jgi:hypothetical protein